MAAKARKAAPKANGRKRAAKGKGEAPKVTIEKAIERHRGEVAESMGKLAHAHGVQFGARGPMHSTAAVFALDLVPPEAALAAIEFHLARQRVFAFGHDPVPGLAARLAQVAEQCRPPGVAVNTAPPAKDPADWNRCDFCGNEVHSPGGLARGNLGTIAGPIALGEHAESCTWAAQFRGAIVVRVPPEKVDAVRKMIDEVRNAPTTINPESGHGAGDAFPGTDEGSHFTSGSAGGQGSIPGNPDGIKGY